MADQPHPTRQNPIARALRAVGRTRTIADRRERQGRINARKQIEEA